MSWTFETTNRAGTTTGFVVPRRVTIDRRLNAPTTVQVLADADQAQTLTMSAIVRGWRTPSAGGDRELRVSHQVVGVDTSAAADDIETVSASCTDGYGMLAWRNLYTSVAYGDVEGGTFGIIPRGIIFDQISIEDGVDVIGLYVSPDGDSGPERVRQYDIGKNVQEIIQQLAEVDDGFFFRVDPYTGTHFDRLLFSEFVLLYPGSGDDLDVVFEFGHGGAGNVQSAEVKVVPPANYVRAYGAGEEDDQVISTVLDESSIDEFGYFHTVLSLTDVEEQETLDQHALDALRPAPQITYSCTPVRFGPNLPVPWEDFDVGDTVLLRLNGDAPYMRGELRCRVTEFQVTVDENAVESLTGLTLEVESDA